MSGKIDTTGKIVSVKGKRSSVDLPKQLPVSTNKQEAPGESPRGVSTCDNCSTTFQLTVKTKGRKRTMVSGSLAGQKAIEEKKRPCSSGETARHNWSRAFHEQNKSFIKQGVQHLGSKMRSSKSTRQNDAMRVLEPKKLQKYEYGSADKYLDQVPVKQVASRNKSEEQSKTVPNSIIPSSTSLASSTESIIVVDRAVQCGGIFDCSNDRFNIFNPVRTLGFLMKELEGLVSDERSGKILSDMEQALIRIPTEPGKPTTDDLERLTLGVGLEGTIAKLEGTCKQMDATCETLREQKESLQRQVQKQAMLLEASKQRETDLHSTLANLEAKLNDATETRAADQGIIVELREDNKRLEKENELARQSFMEVQYLKLEKEKLLVLSSYKDSQLIELRTAMKDLQSYITEQLTSLREFLQEPYMKSEDSPSREQISIIRGGIACSSPTPTSSEHSNILASWRGLSDISLSTVERQSHCGVSSKKPVPNKTKIISFAEGMSAGDSDKNKFLSLPVGEASYAMSIARVDGTDRPGFRNGNEDIFDKRDGRSGDDDKDDDEDDDAVVAIKIAITAEADGLGGQTAEPNLEKVGKENSAKSVYRAQLGFQDDSKRDKKQRRGKDRVSKAMQPDDDPKISRKPLKKCPINIEEQFQSIFRDIRQQSRFPVRLPSPPRNFPHPDWSDRSDLSTT